MKKLFAKIAITVAGITGVAVAQQDPQFTQWMHNKILYNPGYAGTSGAICGNIQFRQQWANFDGAPTSIALGADMRLQEVPVGLGLSVINDKIGPMSTTFARFAGSYNFLNVGKGTLGVGLDVGMLQKSISANWIAPEPGKLDPTIPGVYEAGTNPDLNRVTYDLGFGAFYQIPNQFYVGLSSTHLPAQTIGSGDVTYAMTRHYYAMAGYTFRPGNSWHEITPQIKYKSDLAAGAFDANLTYGFLIDRATYQKVSLGATYRMGDAAAVLLGYQHPFGQGYMAKVGYSFDFILSKIKGYSSGTHEIVLGVCYTPKKKTITTYGDDRFLN